RIALQAPQCSTGIPCPMPPVSCGTARFVRVLAYNLVERLTTELSGAGRMMSDFERKRRPGIHSRPIIRPLGTFVHSTHKRCAIGCRFETPAAERSEERRGGE